MYAIKFLKFQREIFVTTYIFFEFLVTARKAFAVKSGQWYNKFLPFKIYRKKFFRSLLLTL